MSEKTPSDLAAARRVVDAHECAMRGHDWQFTLVFGQEYPIDVFCGRDCGIRPARVVPPAQKGGERA